MLNVLMLSREATRYFQDLPILLKVVYSSGMES
jgi:hypothetical protein